ncbi:putative metal-binding protein [Methanonatronarchaeum thermophilum]|uniref:Putative metal-binding protein n=1 Tax=Methanonatronarchaeum thermophilum TaxID=1927129 RepID=A0A1Y3GDF6_9EURY|nr:DUF2284 domain-containing protein [Methanonatronarchaeum thermophilum]OUJ19502.1 putative metal-binding protein [Methanonatronarchaeum thermophilum]
MSLDVGFLDGVHGDYRVFDAGLIVVEDWVRMRCRFGCSSYGRFFSCPPFTPSVEETRALVGEYDWAVMLFFRDLDPGVETSSEGHYFQEQIKGVHEKMLEVERQAFLNGFYKAFAFWGLPCGFCNECTVNNNSGDDNVGCSKDVCRHPGKVRPTIEGCGIDAFQTAERIGIDLEILLDPSDKTTIYSILLLD